MKKVMSLLALTLFAGILVLGCASHEPTRITTPATDKKIKQIPDWYLEPPSNPDFIYSTGTATSRDLQMARDKAAQAARLTLAQSLESKFSALTKRFQEEVGTELEAQYLEQLTIATKDVVNTSLVGVNIDRTEMDNEDGVFRCYVLLQLDVDYSNQLLANKIREQEQLLTRLRATEAFKELDAATATDE